jgi:hypothetical protein
MSGKLNYEYKRTDFQPHGNTDIFSPNLKQEDIDRLVEERKASIREPEKKPNLDFQEEKEPAYSVNGIPMPKSFRKQVVLRVFD